MRISAADVSRAVNGVLHGPDVEALGVAFDSRSLQSGQAFVAIVGDRDGHEYLDDARVRGATFALVQTGRSVPQMTCIEVPDTVVGLGQWAQWCRESLAATVGNRVVGITGSVGKTSTKNLIRAVLDKGFTPVHAAAHSLNNDIGVPVTIINAPDNCAALVLEMGMRGLGEIERLCSVAHPVIGVVTAVGDAHSERVGGIEGVAQAKGELVESLPENGTAVLNVDDPRVRAMASRTWAKVMTYGTSVGADVRWTLLDTFDDGRLLARFEYDGESATATPALPGVHMVANAAAAIAVGIASGMTLDNCVAAIGQETSEPGRLVWKNGINGSKILDDTYNANSSSMVAALQVLASTKAHRRLAILGEMKEIDAPQSAHENIARVARELEIEVFGVDTDLYGTERIDVTQIVSRLGLTAGDVVLVKGSRASRMERIVDALCVTETH